MSAVFCDTSVLIAALDGSHVQHEPCITLFGRLKAGSAYCALHSYAEFYAVMSGKPSKPKLRSTDVGAMIDRIDRIFTPVTLTRREYCAVVQANAEAGVIGGRTYDALILACALKSPAETIYTLNEKDFRALAPPDIGAKIRQP